MLESSSNVGKGRDGCGDFGDSSLLEPPQGWDGAGSVLGIVWGLNDHRNPTGISQCPG